MTLLTKNNIGILQLETLTSESKVDPSPKHCSRRRLTIETVEHHCSPYGSFSFVKWPESGRQDIFFSKWLWELIFIGFL